MSEFEKVQCTCAHGYTCRAMKDPSCCAHNCDYNDVVDALDKVTAERDAALAQLEQLKGIKPELPQFPPQGSGLPRYGIRWNGPTEPLTVPFDDGYWTPYHLALAQNAELVAQVEALKIVVAVHERELPRLQNKSGEDKLYLPLSIAMNSIVDAQELRKKDVLKIQAEAVQGYLTALSAELDRKGMVSPSAFGEKYIKQLKAGEV